MRRWLFVGVALLVGCGSAAAPSPSRPAVSLSGGSISQAFALDAGDYDAHFTPAEQGCVYLLSLNGGSPNLLIPDADGNAAVIDNGAGSAYHLGPDPRDASCAPTWAAVLTPKS